MGGMLSMFMPQAAPNPQAPPRVPAMDTQAVQDQVNNDLRKRAVAQGRASTMLTDPSRQRDPELNQQKMALG